MTAGDGSWGSVARLCRPLAKTLDRNRFGLSSMTIRLLRFPKLLSEEVLPKLLTPLAVEIVFPEWDGMTPLARRAAEISPPIFFGFGLIIVSLVLCGVGCGRASVIWTEVFAGWSPAKNRRRQLRRMDDLRPVPTSRVPAASRRRAAWEAGGALAGLAAGGIYRAPFLGSSIK